MSHTTNTAQSPLRLDGAESIALAALAKRDRFAYRPTRSSPAHVSPPKAAAAQSPPRTPRSVGKRPASSPSATSPKPKTPKTPLKTPLKQVIPRRKPPSPAAEAVEKKSRSPSNTTVRSPGSTAKAEKRKRDEEFATPTTLTPGKKQRMMFENQKQEDKWDEDSQQWQDSFNQQIADIDKVEL